MKIMETIKIWTIIKKYLNIYKIIFYSTLSSLVAYRANFVIQSLYGPAYVSVMYWLLAIAFNKTDFLGGWNESEGILLFIFFQWLFTICVVLFVKGSRHFLWSGFRNGDLDLILTKPVNPQFLVMFSKPELEQAMLLLSLTILLVWKVLPFLAVISAIQFLGFTLMTLLGILIVYFSLTLYTVAGFYLTRAGQIVEVYNKIFDFAQYPLNIFPLSFQLIAISILPLAFASYFPTLFLLGKGEFKYLILAIFMTTFFALFNKFAWQFSMKKYSSASS